MTEERCEDDLFPKFENDDVPFYGMDEIREEVRESENDETMVPEPVNEKGLGPDTEKSDSVLDPDTKKSDSEDEYVEFFGKEDAILALKCEGNGFVQTQEWDKAEQTYTRALELMKGERLTGDVAAEETTPDVLIALWNNRSLARLKGGDYVRGSRDAGRVIKRAPDNEKARLRRWQCAELEGKSRSVLAAGLEDAEWFVERNPGSRQWVDRRNKLKRALEDAERLEQEKVMGQLKDVGNSLLGLFGMSLDNFRAEKDPETGSYSIKMQ